jgi:ABC-type transporter Mla subunit MlaD
MPSARDIGNTAHRISATAASLEELFLDIGGRLETSIGMVTILTQVFAALSDEFKGGGLQQAAGDLAKIVTRITALARLMGSELGNFNELTALTTTMRGRVAQMSKAVDDVGMLAINAKITAAHIGDAGEDVESFATTISQAPIIARASLAQFAAELASVAALLRDASHSQTAIDSQQSAILRAIPLRLGQSLAALNARGKRAAATTEAVGAGSLRIGKRIGDAVRALQIGDITRQRIEHAAYALRLLGEPLVPQAAASAAWPALSQAEYDRMQSFFFQVQAAQLIDTADEFDQEIHQIAASLAALAEDARDILRQGHDVFASADGACSTGHETFLGALASEVGDVDRLLGGFRAAHDKADEVTEKVSQANTKLIGHIGMIRSLEADIRLIGLNTTLKCGRLGVAGRPLAVIAQELRGYSDAIGSDASEIMTALDRVMAIAGAGAGSIQAGNARDIAEIASIMAQAMAQLEETRQKLTDAFASLARDGETVAGLLQETAVQTTLYQQIGRTLRQAAAGIGGGVMEPAYDCDNAPPQALYLIDLFARSYTMQRERGILERYAPAHATPPAPTQDSALEDVFF